jgi:hypothetical protein
MELIQLKNMSFTDEHVNKLSLRKMCEVIDMICTDNRSRSESLLKWVVATLKVEVHIKFRTVYAIYKKLVHIEDSYT